ncbi:MAG: BRCT domain-containing protein, partial [Planctomycetota bacterium]
RLPRCPAGDYTASQPEELFCPYHAGAGGAGARAQLLKAIPKEVNMGMKVEDPIVVGDLVGNPFFEPGKRLHFAVKGDPDNPVVREFKTEDFVAAIRWHGGIIDADLGAQTDVLLTGKYAADDVRKARELGVDILRQYETFDFLRD